MRPFIFTLALVCSALTAFGDEKQPSSNPQSPAPTTQPAATPTKDSIACVLRVEPASDPEKGPTLKVELINKTQREIYLVGILDGSDGMRYPHCIFTVSDADGKEIPLLPYGRCGNTDPLDEKSFVKVAPGASFDPLAIYRANGFSAIDLIKRHAEPHGEFRIRFAYSTTADKIDSWLGGPLGGDKLVKEREHFSPWIARVPKTAVTSNEVTVKLP